MTLSALTLAASSSSLTRSWKIIKKCWPLSSLRYRLFAYRLYLTHPLQIKQQSWIRWIQPDFVRYYLVLSEQSLQTHISMNTPKASLYRELQSIYPNSYWLQMEATASGADLNEEVFCDKTNVSHDITDRSTPNHFPPIDFNGDPLSVSLDSKLNSNKRLSSGSDQSLQNSIQSLSLNDLSERYLQSLQPKTALEGMTSVFETMLKEFITKTLIPWAEKQIKVLGEAIAQRKGFRRSIFSATKSLINNMSSSTVGLKVQSGAQSVVYLPEAPEMQLRKLADLSMSLRMYDLAYNSYYASKKDFQSEGAWLYYAASCEASAVASYYTSKFQRHYFEQSVNCYVDSCRAMTAATRATILATEACRQLWPNEAANLYIRMTGDDSDLRSALFLEQASRCFVEQSGLRRRKSAFHYVLAGHRYNRCGLKHFALACYRQFVYDQWPAAADHVNLTVARLFISIANTNQSLTTEYRAQGLELLRMNANKQLFFQEFIREIKRDLDSNSSTDTNYFYLDLPSVVSVTFEPIEGIGKDKNNNCFVGEELLLKLCLRTPFLLDLHQLRFFTDNSDVKCPDITCSLGSTDEEITVIYLSVVPLLECEFTLLGLEFQCDNQVPIRCRFSDKHVAGLHFKSHKSLPSIAMDIRFHTPSLTTSQTTSAIEVFATEVLDLSLGLGVTHNGWKPSSIWLSTDAILLNDSLQVLDTNINKQLNVNLDSDNRLRIQMPSEVGSHSIYFKLNYSEESTHRSRVITKTIGFDVKECLSVEANIESVVSLRNNSSDVPIFVKSCDQSLVEIPAQLTTHLLSNGLSIAWTQPNGRYGVIRLLI